MIVWIDGPMGIGKSTISRELEKKLANKSMLISADYYWINMLKENKYSFCGGCYPHDNENFINIFKEKIQSELKKEKRNRIIIIDMALIDKKAKEGLFDHLKKNNEILHIILTAEKDIIEQRIENDTKEREKEDSLLMIETSLKFLEENFEDALKIDTNNSQLNEISDEIIKYINSFKNN